MALEETSPDGAWHIYKSLVEDTEFGATASPMLVVESTEDDDNLLIIAFQIGEDHDAERALREVVDEVLKRGLDPYRALLSGEVWIRRMEQDGLDEAAGFIYTSRSELEWIAEAPFTRTREGVRWHRDLFTATMTVDDRSPLVDILRGMVGRFS